MPSMTYPDPALDLPFPRVADMCYALDIDANAGTPFWFHGRIVGNPSFVENGPDGVDTDGSGAASLVSYVSSDGVKGLRANPAASGTSVRQGQQRLGAIFPKGSFTIALKLRYVAAAWSAIANNTHALGIIAQTNSSAVCPFRFFARWTSATTFVVAVESYSQTAGTTVATAATWTYGGAGSQPAAPAADTPHRIICTFDESDRKLRLYVQDPTGPLGGYRLVSTSVAIPAGNEVDDTLKSEFFYDLFFFANYLNASPLPTGNECIDDFVLMPGVRPPGSSWSYNDTHSLSVDTGTSAGTINPRAVTGFHRPYFGYSKPSTNIGVKTLGFGGTTTLATVPNPRDNGGLSEFWDKLNGVRFSSAVAGATATETIRFWTNGRDMIDPLTLNPVAGSDGWFDGNPIYLQALSAMQVGVKEIVLCHNHYSELISGTSDFRSTLNRLTDTCASHSHGSYHPHTGGAAMDRLDADILVSMIHYIESIVGPGGETLTVKWVKIGTEADTTQQWAATNAAVDQAYRYRYCRQAILDYCAATGHAAINIAAIGFAKFVNTTGTWYTIFDAFLAQCAAWGIPVDYWDPHFHYGVGGFHYADRVATYRAAANGLTPGIQTSPPKIISTEQVGFGEGFIDGALSSQYRGFANAADVVGDVRRMFPIGKQASMEGFLIARYMARTNYARVAMFTPINTGLTAAGFNAKTDNWWYWARGVDDGREMAGFQFIRMQAECTGTLHALPTSTNPNVKALSGTRADGVTWVWFTLGNFATLPHAAHASLSVALGAGRAGASCQFFRATDAAANYITLDGFPNAGTIANMRIAPEALTADGSGNVALTGLEGGTFLLLVGTPTDTSAPTVTSAEVLSSGNTLRVTFSEDVNPAIVVAGFALSGGWTLVPGTRNSTPGAVVDFPISNGPIYAGAVVTLSYDQTPGNLTDTSGNEIAAFTGGAVTNNSTVVADTTPPTFSSATVDAFGTTLRAVWSENVNPATGVAGVTLSGGYTLGSGSRVGSPGNTVDFPITNGPIPAGASLTAGYNPTPGNLVDLAGNEQASTSGFAVTNNSTYTPDTTAPTITAATIDTTGTQLTLTLSENCNPASGAAGFSIGGITLGPGSRASSPGSVYNFSVLSAPIAAGVGLTLAYDPISGNVVDLAGNEIASVSGVVVTNNSTVAPAVTGLPVPAVRVRMPNLVAPIVLTLEGS